MVENKMKNIITTCCPSINRLIELYHPEVVEYMAPVVSPMIASARLIKQALGKGVKVVFVGPVSYTHLDVYKRQRYFIAIRRRH